MQAKFHPDSFEGQMIAAVTELKTDMKSLVGNGQPGRVGKLEERMNAQDKLIWKASGVLVGVGWLVNFIVNKFVLHR